MAIRIEPLVFLASVVVHAGFGFAVVRVEPRELPPPPPIVITVRELPVDEPEVVEPEPEPKAEPEPETEPIEPAEPEVEPEPTPSEPEPAEPAPAEPTPAEPTPAGPPDFGLELGGEAGPGGLAVPTGDPNGKPGGSGSGGPKKKVSAATKKLAEPEPAKPKSGCVEDPSKPKPIKLAKPTYTEAARAAAIQGAVRLKITVAADGSVEAVEVLLSLDPELDARAVEAAKAATFEPGTRCGESVSATLTVSIKFSL